MEKSAIVHLQQTANIKDIFENFDQATSEKSHTLVPEDFHILDLEKFMPFRRNYRCGFSTDSVNDYIAYVKEFDSASSKCFIYGPEMQAKTILDLGTALKPEHQEHRAMLMLKRTASYSAMLSTAERNLSQKALSDWLEDWKDVINVVDQNGQEMNAVFAASAVRDLTIERARESKSQVGDFSENMSELERMNATSSVALPSEILFMCKPYADLKERVYKLRLSILTGDSKPTLVLRIVQKEQIDEEVVEEFKALIVDKLKAEKCKTKSYIGSI